LPRAAGSYRWSGLAEQAMRVIHSFAQGSDAERVFPPFRDVTYCRNTFQLVRPAPRAPPPVPACDEARAAREMRRVEATDGGRAHRRSRTATPGSSPATARAGTTARCSRFPRRRDLRSACAREGSRHTRALEPPREASSLPSRLVAPPPWALSASRGRGPRGPGASLVAWWPGGWARAARWHGAVRPGELTPRECGADLQRRAIRGVGRAFLLRHAHHLAQVPGLPRVQPPPSPLPPLPCPARCRGQRRVTRAGTGAQAQGCQPRPLSRRVALQGRVPQDRRHRCRHSPPPPLIPALLALPACLPACLPAGARLKASVSVAVCGPAGACCPPCTPDGPS